MSGQGWVSAAMASTSLGWLLPAAAIVADALACVLACCCAAEPRSPASHSTCYRREQFNQASLYAAYERRTEKIKPDRSEYEAAKVHAVLCRAVPRRAVCCCAVVGGGCHCHLQVVGARPFQVQARGAHTCFLSFLLAVQQS